MKLTIYSRRRGIASSFAASAAVGFVAAVGLTRNPLAVVPTALAVVAAGLLAVALFDYPVSTTFDETGVTRKCLLRSQHLPWAIVPMIRRSPASRKWRIPKFFRKFHYDPYTDPEAKPVRGARHYGGLVALRHGSRPYLLVSHVESRGEYDDLVRLVEVCSPSTFVEANRPPDGVIPTDFDRRRRGDQPSADS